MELAQLSHQCVNVRDHGSRDPVVTDTASPASVLCFSPALLVYPAQWVQTTNEAIPHWPCCRHRRPAGGGGRCSSDGAEFRWWSVVSTGLS